MQMTKEFGRYQLLPLAFVQDAVADAQTAVAMNISEVDAAACAVTAYTIPWPFQVIGISIFSDSARTAGTLTVDATIDGTVTGLQAALNGTDTLHHEGTQRRDTDNGAAGSRVGCKLTTASWTPVTANIAVAVFILVDLLGV